MRSRFAKRLASPFGTQLSFQQVCRTCLARGFPVRLAFGLGIVLIAAQAVLLKRHSLSVDDLFFQVFQKIIVSIKLSFKRTMSFKRTISDATSTAQKVYDLIEHLVAVHHHPSRTVR
jgi:hypothetical protein